MLSAGVKTEANGFLLDGESPTPQPVRVSLLDTSLRFLPLDGRKSQMWEFSAVDWEATRNINNQLRLKLRESDQWLVLTEATLIGEVQAERKHWTRRNFWSALPDTSMAVRAGAGTMIFFLTLWLSWPMLTKPAAGLVPESTRNWLGDSAQKLIGMDRLCTAPEGRAALDRLTKKLTTGHPELRHVRVIPVESSMINALTLANDKVLLTSAIIAQAGSPDEIAGILAHEFGHVAHRHVLRAVLGQALMKLVITIVTGVHSSEVDYINSITNSAHGRDFEAEADATGIRLLRDAGIATQGLGEFFNRMAKREGVSGRFLKYFNTHPPSTEREKLMRETVVANAAPAMDAKDWLAIKNACPASRPQREMSPIAPVKPDDDLLPSPPHDEPQNLPPTPRAPEVIEQKEL